MISHGGMINNNWYADIVDDNQWWLIISLISNAMNTIDWQSGIWDGLVNISGDIVVIDCGKIQSGYANDDSSDNKRTVTSKDKGYCNTSSDKGNRGSQEC